MKKYSNIITALSLSANIVVCAQEPVNEQLLTFRVKPTNASGIILAGHIENSNHVSFEIQKVEPEACAIGLTISTLLAVLPALDSIKKLVTKNNKCGLRETMIIGWFFIASSATAYFIKCNKESTHGKHWFKSTESQDLIELEKHNETWHIRSRSSKPNGLQKLSGQEAQQLAQEIIAQHNPDVKDKDLYTSPILQKLVDDFKAQGTK